LDEICDDFDATAQNLIQKLREKYREKHLPMLEQMKDKFNTDIKNLSRTQVDQILEDKHQTYKSLENSLYDYVEKAAKNYADDQK
jgi:hypothetical protein